MKRFSDSRGYRTETVYDRDTRSFGYRAEPLPAPDGTVEPTLSASPAEAPAAAPAQPIVNGAVGIRSRRQNRFTLASRRL